MTSYVLPREIAELISKGEIVYSEHYRNEMEVSVEDILFCLLESAYFVQKQKDEKIQSKYKWIIYGESLAGQPMRVVGKIIIIEKKKFFIITAFLER